MGARKCNNGGAGGLGGWEMARWLKHLLYKLEVLSSDPQNLGKAEKQNRSHEIIL